MSPIARGGAPVIGCYRGTLAVSAVYRGITLVWSRGGTASATVNFAAPLTGSEVTDLSFGSCISTFSGDGQNVNIIKGSTADSTAWRNTLGELGPVAWRIPLAWNGGSPGSGAGGARSSGDAADYIRAIKNIGGTPIVAVSGTTNDNDILAADAANLVRFFNDNGGQNGGPVTRWIIGNEPDNGFGMTNYINGGNGSDGFNTIVTAMRNASTIPLSIAGPALVTYADYKEGDFNAFFDACGANVDVVDFHMYDGNDLPRYTAGMAWLRDAIASRPSMADRVTIQVGEYNYASYYAEPDKGANQFWTSANTVAGASTIGRVLNYGGAAYQYSDNNGPLGMITPGSDLNGAPLGYRIPTPSYYGVKMWSGGNLFRRPTGSMASCVTTIPGVEVYASTGHKNIVVVNKNTTAVADFVLAMQGTTQTGVCDVWQTAPGTDPTDPNGPQWQDPTRIYSAGFTDGRLPLSLPAQTVTTIVLEPGGYQPATVDVDPEVRAYSTTSHLWEAGTETVARPAQVQAGDLMVLFTLADSGTSANLTVPTQFTELGRRIGNPGVRMVVSYRVATASEPASYTYASYPGADGASMIAVVRNWDGNTANLKFALSTATNTTMNAPSVTPATSRSLLLTGIATDDDVEDWTWGWRAPATAGIAGYVHNADYWCSGALSQETVTGTTATGTRTWSVVTSSTQTTRMTFSLTVGAGTATKTITEFLTDAAMTGGSGGEKVDATDLTFEDSTGLSSRYHLYADGLDWTKTVGLLVYTDGSGEWGLDTPHLTDNYLLGGQNGLVAVAKRQNMVLLTPRAPGGPCDDGDGVCWYDHSAAVAGGPPATTPWQKLEWSNELIRWVLTRYNIDRRRIAIGGFSSGAQWTTAWFGPKYASEIMLDGVAVGIGYGGPPRVAPNITTGYKAAVEHVWDVGDADPSYVETTWDDGVQAGRAWYQANGFAVTDLVLVPGAGHEREDPVTGEGPFGAIMEREITARVPPTGPLPSTTPVATTTGGSGGQYADLVDATFTGTADTSTYHLYAAHIPQGQPVPLFVHLHGDGAGDYTSRTGSQADYAAIARNYGGILLVPRTPDTTDPQGWYQNGTYIAWFVELLQEIYDLYDVDLEQVYISGYSAGAEGQSYYLNAKHPDQFLKGASVMIGGGGITSGWTLDPEASQGYKDNVLLRWISGADDVAANSSIGFDAVEASANGHTFYQGHGFNVGRKIVPGLDHYQSQPYGPFEFEEVVREARTAHGFPLVPQHMTPAVFRNLATRTIAAATTDKTIGRPLNTTAGDLMVMVLSVYGTNSGSAALPAGFTLLGSSSRNASHTTYVGYKTCTLTTKEPETYTPTIPSGCSHRADLLAYENADVTRIGTPVFTTTAAAVGNHPAPSVTPTTGNGILLSFASGGGGNTWTPPAGMTERTDSSTGASHYLTLTVAEEPITTAAATGVRNFVNSSGSFSQTTGSLFIPSLGSA